MTSSPAPGAASGLRQAAPLPRPWQLLVLSAESAEALDAATGRLAAWLAANPQAELAAVSRALTRRAGAGAAHRRILVAKDAGDAAEALSARDPQRVFTATVADGEEERPVAFLFPGLGEQYVGMARGLYRSEPAFRAAFDQCAELLLPHLGADLREVVFPDTPEKDAGSGGGGAGGGIDLRAMLMKMKEQGDAATQRLNRTEMAQPAVFATDYALGRLWLSWGVRPAGMIGHSLGEYAAATVAGILPLEGAAALVARRARMISELPGGVMLAVPLSEAETRPLLGEALDVGAVNAPTTCVVSGPEEAVAALEAELGTREVVSRRLPTTHAFHSRMMEPIVPAFVEMLRQVEMGEPALPVVSNVTGTWMTPAEARDPGYWARHLVQTVRFSEGVQELARDPRRVFVEVGPGQTLGAFARQAGATAQVILPSIRPSYNKQPDTAFLLASLGRLWLTGARVEWDGLFPGGEPAPADLSAAFAD